MNYITYNIASKKPLVVGFTEECNENHITFTGFEKQYEGDVSTVYLMVDDLGLYPLGPEGLEMTVDVRHTYREGRFDAILVERVADGSYCRKSTPFTYVVEHSPTVRHIAIPQTPQWQDWFGPMSELYQKVKMDYEDGKLGPKWGAIHGDINDQEDLIEKLDGDYQKKLTAGQNITITEVGDNVVISGEASNYHAGDNITIDSDNVISATDTTYSAGENISIDENNVISAVDTKAEWGDITGTIGAQTDLMNQFGILDDAIDDVADDLSDHMLDTDAHPTEAQKAEWSGKQDKLTAGEGIDITDNVISTTYADTVWGNISGDIEDQTDLTGYIATEIGKEAELRSTGDTNLTNTIQQVASNLGTHSSDTSKHVTSTEKASWTAKQDKLTAGTNITIDANNVISASGSLESVDWGDIEGDIDNQTDLKNKFDSIDGKADEIAQDLADEVTRATGKETTIEGKIDTEAARAAGEEARIEGEIDTHTSNSNIHVTAAKKSEWDAKMSEPSTEGTSGQALLTDGAGNRYWGNVASGEWGSISGDIADQTDLQEALDDLSDDISDEVTRATTKETALENAVNTHTGNTTIHVTSEEKSTWTGKQDKLTAGTNITISNTGVISASGSLAEVSWGGITGTLENQTDLQSALDDKADDDHTHTRSDITDFSHTHTKSEISDFAHNHDDRYYTETEIDSKLSGKADSEHTHDDRYYTETEIDTALNDKVDKITGKGLSTNDYSNTDKAKVDAIPTDPKYTDTTYSAGTNIDIDDDNKINATDTTYTAGSGITISASNVISATGGGTADAIDWGHINGAISDQLDLQAALDNKSDSTHTHDNRYYTEDEMDTKLGLKSDVGHKHVKADIQDFSHTHTKSEITDFAHTHDDRYYTESEVDDLLDNKADSTHTHDDRYYTESETDTKLATKVAIAQGATHAGKLLGINSSGNVTPIDAPITGVSDVQINSTSIVDEDGVASIPRATSTTLGVVKVAGNGISINAADSLVIQKASTSNIDDRTDNYNPIVSSNIDYAVKAALTDGVGAAYTTTEQTAARTRIGAAASSHTHDDRYYTETEIDDKFTEVNTDIAGLEDDVADIQALIPSEATSSNQLADKAFVNSSITSNTATFRGTYNSTTELPTTGITPNDYAFVISVDTAGNTVYNRYKYTNGEWLFEYPLNNSSFTAQQWASINSGATTTNIGQIATNKTNIESIIEDVADLTSGKSDVGHTHDDRYFTESEVTNKLLGKVDVNQGIASAGKFLKVNASGNVEAAELPDTGVLDVTVNGTSVVDDSGTAEIPKATTSSFGVVQPTGALQIDNNGKLAVIKATDSDITNRTESRAIYSSNLDYAVKAALTDGEGDAYTTTEQAAARTRIGAAASSHTHTKSEITDFAHTHTKSQITDFAHNHDDLYYTEDEVDTLLEDKAAAVHSHNDLYYTESEIDTKLSGKSDTSHTHDDRYYTETEVTNLLSGKANATHDHDSQYYTKTLTDELLAGKSDASHNHNSTYYTQSQVDTKLSGKADTTHTHATSDVTGLDTALAGKAAATHTHAITDVTDLQTTLAGKSDTGHTHDDRYYTESETDTKLATKVAIAQGSTYAGKILGIDSEGNVTPVDKPVGSVTDVKVNNVSVLVSGVANVPLATGSTAGAVTVNDGTYGLTVSSGNVRVSAANAAAVKAGTHSYAPITPATENAATFYGLAKAAGDTTQASSSNTVGTYTDTAKQKIQTMLGVSASNHNHDSRYYTETEVDTALAGKSDTGHGHAISDITNLQTTLDGKSVTGHTHDDRYFTEDEVTTKLATKSDTSHTHDTRYYQQSEIDTKLAGKSDTSHNHDTAYYTKSQVDTALSGKSDSTHTHDSRYYTESEIDTKLAGKASSTHSHAITDVTNLQSSLNAKLDINQGTTHADKFLKIGLDGNIVPAAGGAKGEPGVEIVEDIEDAADDTRVAIVDDGTGTTTTIVERSDVAGVLNLDKTATAGYVWKATATGGEWAVGSGGEPDAYIKNASVSGNTLTLTKKDNTTVQFTPPGPDAYLKSATVSGNSLQITNNNNATTTYTPPVVDVKIGSTSIVSSGTASIPIATESTAGVVKIAGANSGIQIDSTSQKISTSGATTSMIDARSNAYCGITPSVLNYAVTAALTDANHLTLTNAQKETAQAVLGISGGGTWGSITGTLSDQTDLQTALNGKSNTGHTHANTDITGLGSAATASTTTSVTSGSSALITSGAIYTALGNRTSLGSAAGASTTTTIASGGSGLPTAGTVYNFAIHKSSSTGTGEAKMIWTGTESQYNAISTKDSNTLYFITE